MSCSFDVKDGKLVNVQYDGGDFDCSKKHLMSLEGCPDEVGILDCSDNQLTSLKGVGREVAISLICSNNPNLEDISDIPSNCMSITIQHCPKIKKFPKKIDAMLAFVLPTGGVRRRIKQVSFYEIIEEDKNSITVQQKSVGAQLLDEL